MCDLQRIDHLLSDEDDFEDSLDSTPTPLFEGIDLKELLKTHCTQFTVQINEDAALEEQKTLYNEDKVFDHINLDCLGHDDEPDEFTGKNCAPGDTPFDQIASKMFDLTADGKVKKRIISEGYGEVAPQDALVWIHYNSYVEYAEVPFDSSYLRGHTTMIRLNQGRCILGLDIGLATMKMTEKSQFLIHYDYAYGKLGVPPRIPPESEILIHVELKRFVDNALAMKLGKATDEELQEMSFEEIYKGALGLMFEGNTAFNSKKYPLAVKMYKTAVNCLENSDKKSEEDEDKFRSLLLKLFSNLAVTYNKQNQPRLALTACNNALHYNREFAKAYYQKSIALLQLSAYDEAREFAIRARQYQPHNHEISNLLLKIDEKMKLYESTSVSFAKKTIKFSSDEVTKKKEAQQIGGSNVPGPNKSQTEEKVNCSEVASSNVSGEMLETSEENVTEKISLLTIDDRNNEKPEVIEIGENQLPLNGKKNEPEDYTTKIKSNKGKFFVPQCGYEFELETIKYIEEFIEDPKELSLPLPFGLTYEEQQFFRTQAKNFGLSWQETEIEGKTVIFLNK